MENCFFFLINLHYFGFNLTILYLYQSYAQEIKPLFVSNDQWSDGYLNNDNEGKGVEQSVFFFSLSSHTQYVRLTPPVFKRKKRINWCPTHFYQKGTHPSLNKSI